MDPAPGARGTTDDEAMDPGLASERTSLAWNRSGLAVVVCIAVVLRHLWPLRGTDQLVALGTVAASAVVWALVISALRVHRGELRHGGPVGHRAFGLMTVGTLVLAAGAVTLTILAPG